ncbi:ER lumen protein-retaining receptor [Mycena chlorophos]|uniref:ER lumen protein-retaining receptor n=1 Tax=Mycena chlorophos TaxID=658473 RepID=A0A8H6SE76_MYCCL|nr:ER lumen protein-retaining receptor [Mycena chlorophos]
MAMKRGFLNSSKGKAAISSDATAAPANKPQTGTVNSNTSNWLGLEWQHIKDEPQNKIMRPPIGKIEKVEVPKGFENQLEMKTHDFNDLTFDARMTHICTTLPPVELTPNEPHTECLFVQGTKEIFLQKTPGFPQPLPSPPASPAFRLADIPGKGKGLIATRSLKQGDLILVERPLMITTVGVPVKYPETFTQAQIAQHSLNEFERYAAIVVDRLEESRREAFFALQNSHTEDGSGPIVGRTRTNGLGLANLQPGASGLESMYSAICDHISRLNHSCSPNTQPKFNRAMFAFELYAVREIAEGEELTFQYIDITRPAAERVEACKPYAFKCTCTACIEPTEESDARRQAIKAFLPIVRAWSTNPALADDWLINKCLEQIDLLEKEGMQYSEYYCLAVISIMDSYIALGDAKRASEWAARYKSLMWSEHYVAVDDLLDAQSPSYKKNGMWRMRKDNTPQGDAGKIMKMLAELAGPEGSKALGGGQEMYVFPEDMQSPRVRGILEKYFPIEELRKMMPKEEVDRYVAAGKRAK